MHTITIPISSNVVQAEFKEYCKHFECTAVKDGDIGPYWKISSTDPVNFFWLGANMPRHYNPRP